VKTTGYYSFKWRYANIGSAARPGDVIIDGNITSNIGFASTGSWTTWADSQSDTVWLDVGTHSIRLQASSSTGLANIDNISVTGPSVTAASCGSVTAPVSFVAPSFTILRYMIHQWYLQTISTTYLDLIFLWLVPQT
jgi:arabinan endo-1,5-alpha-L-arabinosidase